MRHILFHPVPWFLAPAVSLLAARRAGARPGAAGGAPRPTSPSDGTGGGLMSGAGSGAGGGANCNGQLPITIRDFTTQNPDFEPGNYVDDKGIVTADLGADGKPVYAGNPNTPTTHGKMYFDQWY